MKESSSFVSIVGLAVSQLNGHQQNTKLIAKERFTCKYIQRFILSKSKQIQSYIRTKQNTSIINIHLQTEAFITFGFCSFTKDFLRVTIMLIDMYFLLSNFENGAFFKPKKSYCVFGITSRLIEIPLLIKF